MSIIKKELVYKGTANVYTNYIFYISEEFSL